MTVIAWDGKMAAADRMLNSSGLIAPTRKIIKDEDSKHILAWCGEYSYGIALTRWFMEGSHQEKWPAFQRTDDLNYLITIPFGKNRGNPSYYEREPVPLEVTLPFMAWGSGRDYAMGAMAMGASAKEAVEIANRFCSSCGFGVDFFYLVSE